MLTLVPSYIQLRRILVPIDFSRASMKALHYAIPFARQFGAELHLVHVVEPFLYPVDAEMTPLVSDNRRFLQAVERKLEKIATKVRRLGLATRAHIKTGRAFRQITQAAKSLKADMIILTTHGYTGLDHFLLGSTAERVIRYAPCPVLSIRRQD